MAHRAFFHNDRDGSRRTEVALVVFFYNLLVSGLTGEQLLDGIFFEGIGGGIAGDKRIAEALKVIAAAGR